MYDTDGKSIDSSAEDGSVDVVLPSDRAPKLWAVGGAIQPDGSDVHRTGLRLVPCQKLDGRVQLQNRGQLQAVRVILHGEISACRGQLPFQPDRHADRAALHCPFAAEGQAGGAAGNASLFGSCRDGRAGFVIQADAFQREGAASFRRRRRNAELQRAKAGVFQCSRRHRISRAADRAVRG